MESKPPDAGAASIPAILDQLWVKFLPEIRGRASVLERAVDALARGVLSPEVRAQAHSAAHKLAGSLGTFGLQQGTALAREAEILFAPERALDAQVSQRLAAIVADLYAVIAARTAS